MRKLLYAGALIFALCISACTAETPPDCSDEGQSAEESLESTASSSEDTEGGQYTELCEEVRALLVSDRQVIDIFANGVLADRLAGDMPGFGEYSHLAEGSEFLYYEGVTALLDAVYAKDSPAIEGFLQNCPSYGQRAVRRGLDGFTEVCFIYNAAFYPDVENATISLEEIAGSGYSFRYTDGKYSLLISAVDTENGLRLTNSLYFAERDRQKSLGWVQDTVVENSGSCKALTGSCLVINLFASDSDSFWTAEEMKSCSAMVSEGIDFLLDSAASYGVQGLSLDTLDVTLTVGTDAADYTVGDTYGSTAFIGTGYDGIKQFTEEYTKGTEYDNVCVLFHFNKHGRSYFVQCDGDYSAESSEYYEYGVLFYSDRSQGEYFSCPAVYAHELLHAFGAKDLYAETVTETGDMMAELLFAGDIMRYEPVDIYKSYVGPLTAKLIGWEEWLDPQLKAMLNECL